MLKKNPDKSIIMQLPNSPQTQLNPRVNRRLIDVLDDIVNKVKIQSYFSIRHPDYKPLEVPAEAVERFHNLPEEMQKKYLSLQLQNFLYGIYYNGSMRSELAADKPENNLPIDLENNTILGIDVVFYQKLHNSNFGQGYFEPGWLILQQETDGSLAVNRNGLRLHIQRYKHLQPSQQEAVVGDVIAVKMPKNLVQNGFYMAVGDAGLYRHNNLHNQQAIVRIYLNLTPDGAVKVMGGLTKYLNQVEIPFQFKVLYQPKHYKRYDSGVLYLDKIDYNAVRTILHEVYLENKAHFKSEIPLFTLQLAPGLGLAEEPNQKFAEQESFGMNRCQIIANGLLETWYQGDDSPPRRIKAILEHFSRLGIDLERVHLNANSEDIYTSFDLS
jgi:HopA1 effector protein family